MLNWHYFHFSSGKRSVKKEIAELILYLLYFISFVDLNKKKRYRTNGFNWMFLIKKKIMNIDMCVQL